MDQKENGSRGRMQILTTLNENYLPRLQVLLTSICVNQPDDPPDIWLIHSGISEEALLPVRRQCALFGFGFYPVRADESAFQGAPVSAQYPREMYYRLLAPHLLPGDLDRILYLDPDTLVINALRPLWETNLNGNLFAAASHTGVTEIANNVNRLRLGTDSDYFNSGVLLMDLKLGREKILPEDVFSYFSEHSASLLLPDQDILNAMYGNQIWEVDDAVWNYDARNYNSYLLRSSGKAYLDWVIAHTAILHFCGRAKPWKPGYPYRFGILYKHYEHLTHSLEVSAIGKKSGNMSFIN